MLRGENEMEFLGLLIAERLLAVKWMYVNDVNKYVNIVSKISITYAHWFRKIILSYLSPIIDFFVRKATNFIIFIFQ